MTYGIPVLVVIIYLKGYWDTFAPRAAAEHNPALLVIWMGVAIAFLGLICWFAFGGRRKDS